MKRIANGGRYVYKPFDRPGASAQLVCFPHAGGSAASYRLLAEALSEKIEVIVVEYPGRGNRFEDPHYGSMTRMIEDYALHLRPLLDRPWIVMGHSFGCQVAFNFTHAFWKMDERLPVHFIASACRPFHFQPRRLSIDTLSDSGLLYKIRTMGGTPSELLSDRDFCSMLIGWFRADMAVSDSHVVEARAPLPMPATVFVGVNDPSTPPACWSDWQLYFLGKVGRREFDGGHFFVKTHAIEVGQAINQIVESARSVF